MMKEMCNAPPGFRPTKSAPASPAKPLGIARTHSDTFHVTNKVPAGDTPYVRAKNVQLVEKDPERAIPLFWAAINAGDRVDSALKDMAIVMKQQNRAEEAIEAIRSLRSRCSDQAQESLDNILLDLYKRCGRLDDQVALLKRKLFLIQQGMAFNGKRTKTARSQGKKFQVSVEQEATRLLGNLGWALMQQNNYIEAEEAYRRALVLAPDNNKMCNLGICLMKQGRIGEAKDTLRRVKPAVINGPRGVDSHLKAYERAQQMLRDLESEMMTKGGADRVEQSKLFDAFLGSSAIWQPQPCKESRAAPAFPASAAAFADEDVNSRNIIAAPVNRLAAFPAAAAAFADENVNSGNIIAPVNRLAAKNSNNIIAHPVKISNNSVVNLNIDAQPFYSSKVAAEGLKRSRSGTAADLAAAIEKEDNWADILPDSKDFEDAIMAAVLGGESDVLKKKKVVEKRLKVFQDITTSLSPKAASSRIF
ncbi:protein POLLENLESS 3-LIKE 2-like [Salvia splendens]|uniref:protein POLLENLESS 3-LIKE 2-like n=1 Tax=Salvia splendens TaxID=180675 RepID=UPI001101297E|nr:protein POLLENLESS 3-LIKE 2-like [Salvia splendens]XP_042028945.1 protein POLLENLESS 3-LIKE 2-like [Salvia splendens]